MAADRQLSPFVFWGQNKQNVTLKVDLKDVKSPDVDLSDEKLVFFANGHGVQGINDYGFTLEFYLPINPKGSKYKLTDRYIEFQLQKQGAGETWPRLTVSQRKPAWLKIDFDNLADDEESEEEGEMRDQAEVEAEMMRKLERDLFQTESKALMDIRSTYLFLYNLFQWLSFCAIFGIIMYRYIKTGAEATKGTYESVSKILMIAQMVAILEIFHVMLGWVRGGLLATVIQVFGRNMVLFGLLMREPRLHERHVVWWLFISWSSIELIRYPYYMMKQVNKDYGFVTWLRYTAWIPLYPLGFLCEGMTMLLALPYYEQSGTWTLELPNSWNISFHFPTFLKIYMLMFLGGIVLNMKYMYAQRKKKIQSSPSSARRKAAKKRN